ncbi:RTA1 like protein-domain-containing protein, partial [Microdochium trichocladiopsis]
VPTGTFYTTSHITITGFTNAHVTMPDKTIDIVIPTCIRTITPDANGYLPPGTCGALYKYYPSFVAAVVAAVAFGILTGVHVWKAFLQYRKGWCWILVMACAWEFLGFVFRTASTKAQDVTGLYLMTQIFILLAPLWINAFAYIVLGRLIHAYRPATHSLLGIPAYVFSALFVTLDVVAFVVQFVGGVTAGPMAPPDEQLRAIHIYMGGIGLQQFFIVVFLGLAVRFHIERSRAAGIFLPALDSWRALLGALYFALAMITLRIVYRFVEMSSGSTVNSLTTSETYLYALEALPMALALLAFAVVHPGKALSAAAGVEDDMPGLFGMV